MTAAAYTNELESSFNSLPGWVQAPLRPIFDKMNEGLEWAAGDPDDLLQAGQKYAQLGQQIQGLVQEQQHDRARLAGHWKGDDYDAFTKKMQEVEQQLGKLGQSTSKTKEVLEAGARACVESANAIIEIIVMVLSFIFAELAINVALSVLTFGASLAAMVAEWIATALTGLARILQVVQKLATILQKVAQIFQKIAAIFKEIKAFLEAVKDLLAMLKEFKQSAKLLSVGKAGWFAAHAGAKAAVSQGLHYGTGGAVTIPGLLGTGIHAGQDVKGAVDAADDAEDAAG